MRLRPVRSSSLGPPHTFPTGSESRGEHVGQVLATRVGNDTAAPRNLYVLHGATSMFAEMGRAAPFRACAIGFAHAY